MVKMTAKGKDGRMVVLLGLSHRNLDKLRADGLDGFIKVMGVEIGIDADILITAGETEATIFAGLQELVGENTDVKISDKLKS